jgi:Ca2+-binding EF-hand superfamily protein
MERLLPPGTHEECEMKLLNALAGSMIAASLMAAPAAFAADSPMKHDMMTMTHDMDAFMKSCDMDHDGMMSKAEMLKHMEKMFDRMDTKKTGKLDKKQTEAFLREFTKESGG